MKYATIIQNSRGAAGRRIHAHRSYFDDGRPRLIVGTEEELRRVFSSHVHSVEELSDPPDEPTIGLAEYLELGRPHDAVPSLRIP